MDIRALLLGGVVIAAGSLPALADDAAPGATLPWKTVEAESAHTNGKTLGPDFSGQTPAREASGRRCVELAQSGQFIEFQAPIDAGGLVLRYSIPDSADGKGLDATLSWSINGKSQPKLQLTSRLTYLYGAYPYVNTPSAGTPRHFWDELRVMPSAVHAGDVVRLEKASDDAAAVYDIDFLDFETVPAPLSKPADVMSVIDFGATANDASDDRPAFIKAIAEAKVQHRPVWIPAGKFVIKGPIDLTDVAVHGAGMWHTTLVGVDDYASANRVTMNGVGSNVALIDFAIDGKLNYRNDDEPNDGIGGTFGSGSVIRNLWVEHTKTGAWITNSDGLLVEGCRFRDTIADGINLCVGMRNTTVRNCTARGGGDDCFAMWPATYAKSTGTAGNNRFVHCTGQLPFLAQAFSIYGGEGNSVEDCEAIDIPYGAGLFASTTFPTEFGFRGLTTYRNIRLTRCGDADGSIATVANLRDLAGLRFEKIESIDSPTDGIKFISVNHHALSDTSFDRVRIINAGIGGAGHGVLASADAVGSATLDGVTVQNPKTKAWASQSPGFKLIFGKGNAGLEDHSTSSAGKSAALGVATTP